MQLLQLVELRRVQPSTVLALKKLKTCLTSILVTPPLCRASASLWGRLWLRRHGYRPFALHHPVAPRVHLNNIAHVNIYTSSTRAHGHPLFARKRLLLHAVAARNWLPL